MDRAIANATERAGLGSPIRVYRGIAGGAGVATLLTSATVAVPVVIFSGALEWRLVVLAYAALVALVLAWLRWGTLRNGHWFVVAEGGVLVWLTPIGSTVAAVPWPEVRDGPVFAGRPRSLRRVLQRQEPGRAWPVTGVLTAAAVALLGWFVVVPLVREPVRAEVPTTNDLARLCDGGDGFRSLPRYSGSGPHPVIVFLGGAVAYPLITSPPAHDTVQLVGCAEPAGFASPEAIATCRYDLGVATVYRGRYRLEVYAAHTGHLVDRLTVDAGPSTGSCPLTEVFVDGQDTTSRNSTPNDLDFAAVLKPLTGS
jgi:hypothetical protein